MPICKDCKCDFGDSELSENQCFECWVKEEERNGATAEELSEYDLDELYNTFVEMQKEYYDDSMDGDAQSALVSAGFGTNEDYGYYGDDSYLD